MCKECVKEVFPDRGSVVLDDGAYILNLAGCAKCAQRSPPRSINRQVVEDEGKEPTVLVLNVANAEESEHEGANEIIHTTTYTHQCGSCDHIIGEHYHKFQTSDSLEQSYYMECILCGKGTDEKAAMDIGGSAMGDGMGVAAPDEVPEESEERRQKRRELYAALVHTVQQIEHEEEEDETDWTD